jgi:hypothetical protein
MSSATATASGDRSVAVGGSIRDSIVVTGDRNVLVVPEALAGTLLQRVARAPTVTPRPRPVAVTPPAYGDRIGRSAEVGELRRASGRSLSVVGEGLIGKTYVVSAAYDAPTSVAAPDGIVFLYGRQRPLRDVLQAVWEAFYDSDPPTVPSDAHVRRDLADREGVVVVDSAELTHADAQALAAALPRSQLVVVTRERSWWDGDAITVGGLAEGDALALLAHGLGGRVAPADEDAARAVCRALGGRPVAIKQVAGLVRGGEPLASVAGRLVERSAPGGGAPAAPGDADADAAVARAAVSRATPSEQELLSALAAFAGVPVGIPLLDQLLGRATGGEAAALAERGLLRRGSPRFALALPTGALGVLDRGIAERTEQLAVRWAAQAPRAALDAELDPLVALWRRLSGGRAPYPAVAALGRALVPALVRARRLATWRSVVEHLDVMAAAAGDTATQAWARHEAGTHAVATGDTGRGVALLRDAFDLRRSLGDRAGMRATRRNLRFAAPPPGLPPWMRAVTFVVVAAGMALLLMTLLQDRGEEGSVDAGAEPTDEELTEATETTDGTDTEGTETEGTETEGTETEATEGTDPTEPRNETEETPGPELWNLTVAPAGTGSGRVLDVTEDGALIDCLEQCTTELEVGEGIDLLADADEGSMFVGWGVETCPEATTCTLAAESDVALVPRFEPVVELLVVLEGASFPEAQVTLDVGETTPISLLDFDPGEPCFDECAYPLPAGATVTLTATAAEPWRFDAWDTEALCDGAVEPCVVTVVEDLTVVARYEQPVRLSVDVTGAGRVESAPEGIACPEVCAADFLAGSEVKLTAQEADDAYFSQWTGDCAPRSPSSLTSDGSGPPVLTCDLTMDASRAVGADFVGNVDETS